MSTDMSTDASTDASNDKVLGMHPVIGRGVLVFAAGMALSAASFVVEQFIIKTAQGRS